MNATLPVADAGTAASAAPTLAPWPLRALLRTAGTLLPHATGQFLARRMLTPRRRPVRPQAWIAAAAALKIPAEGGMVNAYRWGDGGATVLLMHGWEGGVDDFAALVPQLAGAGFSVVAVEAPAHGTSALRRTDVHQMAEALSAVADHVGPVYGVIAHSLGAAAAVQLLADGRHAAARLVLIAPGGELAADIRRLAQALDLPPRCVAALVAALERHYDMPVEMCSISRLARMLNVAALVVHDVDDKVIPFAEGAQVARSLPGARFHATERLGHRRILRDAAVIGSVVEFCRARRARTA